MHWKRSFASAVVVICALLSPVSATGAVPPAATITQDVDRLADASAKLTGRWPGQPPPPIREVSVVARHGRAAVPLLIDLLSDDPKTERDAGRWKVQQQVSLALSSIYAESPYCGRIYCDGDAAARIARVRAGWLQVIASDRELRARSPRELLTRFQNEPVFWRQLEIGRVLAEAADRSAVVALESWLADDDRHRRANAAFVLGRLGDPRGFHTIAAILADRAPRGIGQWTAPGKWTLRAQIREDRYYAAHLLGDLKDPRGVARLIPLLNDADVNAVVPWALAEIGDGHAIGPLIDALRHDDPSRRVYVILALATLKARQALPTLRGLLHDTRTSTLGDPISVAEAARRAIAVISQAP